MLITRLLLYKVPYYISDYLQKSYWGRRRSRQLRQPRVICTHKLSYLGEITNFQELTFMMKHTGRKRQKTLSTVGHDTTACVCQLIGFCLPLRKSVVRMHWMGKRNNGAREVTGFPSGHRCKVFTMTAVRCCWLLLRITTYSARLKKTYKTQQKIKIKRETQSII